MAVPCSRELPSRAFVTGTQPVSTERPVLVLPADSDRRSLAVVNAGDVDVYVTPSQSGSQHTGYLLTPGEGLTLNTAAPVYAVSVGAASRVKWVSETGVPDGML